MDRVGPSRRQDAEIALPLDHLLSLELPSGDWVRAICWQQGGRASSQDTFRAVVGTVQNNIHVLTYRERGLDALGTREG